ncbi:MAG TPA: imelysin family protein [Dongiaceae bacterium]|nr:imelysin family protein [Dongiaceae bacterium]
MPTRRQTLLSAITAVLWQILPRSARAVDRPSTAFNAAFGEKIALPILAQFETAGATLDGATQTLKKAPSAESFAAVVQGFNGVSDAWMAVQLLRFGPLTQNQRLDRIAYWPERSNITEKQIAAFLAAADTSKLVPASFATASIALQGLTALERLLFDSEHGTDGKAVSDKAMAQLMAGTPAAAYRIELIGAIAGNLRQIAKEGRAAWQDFAVKLGKGDQGGFAASPQEATNQIYAGLVTVSQLIGGQKLGLALGKSQAAAKPHQAEQWRSGRSLHNIDRNLMALKQALLGDPTGSAIALVTAPDTAAVLSQKLTSALAACEQALAAVNLPLDLAVTDDKAGRGEVQALLVRINQFRDILTNEMPKAAGITLGFNDLDGDSG